MLKDFSPFILLRYHHVVQEAIKREQTTVEELGDSDNNGDDEECSVELITPVKPLCVGIDERYERYQHQVIARDATWVKSTFKTRLKRYCTSNDLWGRHSVYEYCHKGPTRCKAFYLFLESIDDYIIAVYTDLDDPSRVTGDSSGGEDEFRITGRWWVDMSTQYRTKEEIPGFDEASKKRPRPGPTPVVGTPTPPPSRISSQGPFIPLTLEQEYKTHCLWLRMGQVPCDPTDDALNDIYNQHEYSIKYLEMLTDDAGGLIADNGYPVDNWAVEYSIWKIVDSTIADKNEKFNEEFNINKEMVGGDVDETNGLVNEQLYTNSFEPLSSNSFGPSTSSTTKTKSYKSWLRWFMATVSGCVYSPSNVLLQVTREELDDTTIEVEGEDMKYQLEHITPQSWTHLTAMVNEFRYVVSDPRLVFYVDSTRVRSNQSRSNKPLLFKKGGNEDFYYKPWAIPSANKEMIACVARAVIHATMTYPLLTRRMSNGHNPIKPSIHDM